MSEAALEPVDLDQTDEPSFTLMAPVIAVGATMLVRKLLDTGYRRVTGREAPGPRDTADGLMRVIAWTVATAAAAAIVEVAVYRLTQPGQPAK